MRELWTWRTSSCSQSPRSSLTKGTVSKCFAEWGEKDKVVSPHPKRLLTHQLGQSSDSLRIPRLGDPSAHELGSPILPQRVPWTSQTLPTPHKEPREGLP